MAGCPTTAIRRMPGRQLSCSKTQLNFGLQEYVTVDRDKAATYGITSKQIDNILYDAFGQRQVSVMYTTMNQYNVIMEVAPLYWQRPQTLNDIYLKSSTNNFIPLA